LQTARDRSSRVCRDARFDFARISVEATRHERCKSERAFGTRNINQETTMSKKNLELGHETILVLTSDTVAGVVGGQMSGSSGPTLANQFGSNVEDQRRQEDVAKRRK